MVEVFGTTTIEVDGSCTGELGGASLVVVSGTGKCTVVDGVVAGVVPLSNRLDLMCLGKTLASFGLSLCTRGAG